MHSTCSVSFGRLSLLPRAAADITRPTTNDRRESIPWRPYEDTNLAPSPSAEQAARPMLFLDCLSRLSELATDMVNTFYAPQERFTSRRLAAAYAQYQEWYNDLPDAFRLEKHDFAACVCTTHVLLCVYTSVRLSHENGKCVLTGTTASSDHTSSWICETLLSTHMTLVHSAPTRFLGSQTSYG